MNKSYIKQSLLRLAITTLHSNAIHCAFVPGQQCKFVDLTVQINLVSSRSPPTLRPYSHQIRVPTAFTLLCSINSAVSLLLLRLLLQFLLLLHCQCKDWLALVRVAFQFVHLCVNAIRHIHLSLAVSSFPRNGISTQSHCWSSIYISPRSQRCQEPPPPANQTKPAPAIAMFTAVFTSPI